MKAIAKVNPPPNAEDEQAFKDLAKGVLEGSDGADAP